MKTRLCILNVLVMVSGCLLAAAPPKGKPEEKFEVSQEEKEIIDLTNAERAKEKLPPLKPHPLLFRAARDHTKNMAKQEKMEHKLDGLEPHERTKKVGFKTAWVGENIAAGEAFPPKEVIKAWMDSKAHRDNILDGNFVYIGVGAARSEKGEFYYTQVFGRTPRE